jgi:hypothetical protein
VLAWCLALAVTPVMLALLFSVCWLGSHRGAAAD